MKIIEIMGRINRVVILFIITGNLLYMNGFEQLAYICFVIALLPLAIEVSIELNRVGKVDHDQKITKTTNMKQLKSQPGYRIDDAYVMLKDEKEPCYCVFNDVELYSTDTLDEMYVKVTKMTKSEFDKMLKDEIRKDRGFVEFVNLTPHEVKLNDGTVYPTSGAVARVEQAFSGFDKNRICRYTFGEVIGLPEPKRGVVYIVSIVVINALGGSRGDVVAPATGHPDCIRDEKGQIVSVPGFIK